MTFIPQSQFDFDQKLVEIACPANKQHKLIGFNFQGKARQKSIFGICLKFVNYANLMVQWISGGAPPFNQLFKFGEFLWKGSCYEGEGTVRVQ